MTARLLEETTALLPGQNGGHFVVRCGSILRLQDAKSVKVDRGAMAAWLEENYGRVTMASLVEALRVNKVPWEEKDAVHTTRKTPRTIPPD